ncbi:MAG: hypothetical protein ACM359_14085 [Bacillota bacterium]
MRTYWYAYRKPDGSIWYSQSCDGSKRSMKRHIEYEDNTYIAGPCGSQAEVNREIASWKARSDSQISRPPAAKAC